MLHWIESQSTLVIAGLMFAFCYAISAAAYGCATALSRRAMGEELKTISPVTLTPLAVLLGLLIAFIAARVWDNVARANEHVGQEATALSEVILLSNILPPEIQTKVREAVKEHIDFLEENDWLAMASFRADLRSEAVALKTALTLLLSFGAAERGQEFARQQAVGAIERAFAAREARIRLSKAQIAPIQWTAIVRPREPDPRHDSDDPHRQTGGDGNHPGYFFYGRCRVPDLANGVRPPVCRRRRQYPPCSIP